MSLLQIEGLQTSPTGSISKFGPFNQGARIAIVIDHPTMDDIKSGAPLNGFYGQILLQCMGTAGLTRSDASIHYVFPSASDAGLWTPKTGFTSKGIDQISRLKFEILEANPTVIVPLGEIPLQALTSRKGITKWRNSILESTLCQGFKTIPTICPKVAGREYLYRYHMINDFRRIASESMSREIDLPKRNLQVCPSFDEVMAYLRNIYENKITCGVDIEVKKEEVSCICFAISPTDCMSIPFACGGEGGKIYNYFTQEEETEIWLLIAKILGDPSISQVLQNATFDIPFLYRKVKIITRGPIIDSMIGHHLNYPDFPKNLGFICSIYTREPYYKDEGKDSFKGPIKDWNQYYTYNAKDGAITLEAAFAIEDELVKFGNIETFRFNQRLMRVLFYMMARGIKVDKLALEQHREQATIEQKELQKQLDEIAGFAFNVSSPAQCKKYFYEVKGYKPITGLKKDPKTGDRVSKVTTDNKAMKKLALRGSKEATLVQKIRGYRKLIGTYLNITFDADGRLRCSFNISGTSSGRLSSSETIFGTGTNMQNLPKLFKAFLVSDEGRIFLEMDKAQAEWVVTAYCCGDARMIQTVESGEDAHVNTAHLMFGAPKELIRYEDELLGTESDEEKIKAIRLEKCPEVFKYHPIPNMSMRQSGKKSNHGLNYDLGANGFAATYGMDLRDARRCYELYHRAYPSLHIWHASIRSKLAQDRTLTNLFGRNRRFLARWDDNLFKAAYSYIPQSTVAELLNRGLVELFEGQQEFDYLKDLDIVLQVHDSMLAQYPIAKIDNFVKTIQKAKEIFDKPLIANGRPFVIKTDAKVGFDAKNLFKIKIEGNSDEVKQSLESAINQATEYEQKKQAQRTIELDEDDMEDEDESPDSN